MTELTVSEAELQRLRDHIAAITAEVFPCRRTDYSAEDNLTALRRAFLELRGEGHRLRAELRRMEEELGRTKSELHRPRGDGLSVGEHIALVQRAQAIAATDHAELVRVSSELAKARAQLRQLRRAASRRRATAAAMLASRAARRRFRGRGR